MALTRIVLLPGMDGTGRLFRGFVEHAPAGFAPEVAALPAEPATHEALARRMGPALALDGRCVLVGESYSGALALRMAAEHPVAAVVLVNAFVTPPRPGALRVFAVPPLFALGPPRLAIRHFFVGHGAPAALVDEVRDAVRGVPPRVLAARLAEVLTMDAGEWLARCTAPLLYLRGTEDRLVPERAVRHMTNACDARVMRIRGPHLLLQAAPAQAWAAITRFLHDLSQRRDG